mmetsp:Transcript_83632/g.240326  ORF Transcript_83632/g.240326 Transcript_83632/m.240326 type:complete len:84 (-) Transcript_83632:13-264(-)
MLQILLADENRLSTLPSGLCLSSSLKHISLAGNLLEALPNEDPPPSLHTVSLCGNRLMCLPAGWASLSHSTSVAFRWGNQQLA